MHIGVVINKIQCPVGCPIFVNLNKTTPKGIDRCADRQWYGGVKWHERDLYACRNDQKVLRCYDSPCQSTLGSTSLDGRMDASGKCVKNIPSPPPPEPEPECYYLEREVQCDLPQYLHTPDQCDWSYQKVTVSFEDRSPGQGCYLSTQCCR